MNTLSNLPRHTQIILLFFIAFTLVAIPLTSYILSKNQTKQTSIAKTLPTPIPDPTANWRTYNNPAYGKFTFKYPLESQITEEKPATIVSLNYLNSFDMRFYMNAVSPEECNSSKPIGFTTTPVIINGYEGYSYQDPPNKTKSVTLKNGKGKCASIITETNSVNSYSKISDQILSTFKFTDQTSSYFNVPELEIRFIIPDEIKDLSYVYKNNTPYFSTNSLIEQAKEKGGINNCTKEIGPTGAFSKIDKSTLKDDPNGPWDETIQGIRAETVGKNGNLPLSKEFPNFFLFFSHPNNVCSSDQSIQQLQENQIKALQKAMQTAELIQ